MSDFIQHECGVAFVRLRKPLSYYYDKYGTALYGFNKLFLLLEKQHNRGHDGCGIGSVKLDMPLGQPYMFRSRSVKQDSISRIFNKQLEVLNDLVKKGFIDPEKPETVKRYFEFGGEILVGHLRYGTSGLFNEGACHPYIRRNNWQTRSFMLLGNFNMTNVAELNQCLIKRGQHPVFGTDTQTVLEEIGFQLEKEHTRLYKECKEAQGDFPLKISRELDVASVIRRATQIWDGGYHIAGVVGNGDGFIFRDPHGIRPSFYFENEEIIAFASERVPLLTVFDLPIEEVKELPPGHIAVVKADGSLHMEPFAKKQERTHCSFERIYFSRGNDPEIYQERKAMGKALVPQVLTSIDNDFQNTVFSFVPNTAEIAYHGLMDGMREHRRQEVKKDLVACLKKGELTEEKIDALILCNWPRGEKIAHKDIKMRTFISQEQGRNKLVSHVYDITYGVVHPQDNLVVLDDSIVRGTTLAQSILKILSRTNPKKIVIVSTAPQIRYPDCYGIDMAELGKFIAFQAAIALLKRDGRHELLQKVYRACQEELKKPREEMRNCVQEIYAHYSAEELSAQIGAQVYPQHTSWKGEIELIYQKIENLHTAIPNHTGDWYFTGNYPTPGGYAMVNQAFIHYFENKKGRAYDLF